MKIEFLCDDTGIKSHAQGDYGLNDIQQAAVKVLISCEDMLMRMVQDNMNDRELTDVIEKNAPGCDADYVQQAGRAAAASVMLFIGRYATDRGMAIMKGLDEELQRETLEETEDEYRRTLIRQGERGGRIC